MFRLMRKLSAFTLIELVTVMAVIVVLTGIVLSVATHANQKGAGIRALGEIKAIETACEKYRADNGIYPQDFKPGTVGAPGVLGRTDTLSPKKHFDPTSQEYADAGEFLYKELSGDKMGASDVPDGVAEKEEKVYMREFEQRMLKLERDKNDKNKIIRVYYFQDPWGNPYGYSTAAIHDEQEFQAKVREGKGGAARKSGQEMLGFNASSFDLWSTAGNKPSRVPSDDKAKELEWAKWKKNW